MQVDGSALRTGERTQVRARREDYEEFLHTPVGALRRYLDADSRPLCGEAVIDDPAFRASLEQRRCRYAGSRRDHPLPMNASALKQLTKNWEKVISTANTLRSLFTSRPASCSEALALGMCVAYVGVCLPLFLLYRARGAMSDGQVPGFVSGLHKASIDIASSSQLMLVERFRGRAAESFAPDRIVEGIMDFVEREGLLIGQKGVCAGPPQLIRELLGVMLHGQGRSLDETSGAADELGDLKGLRSYVDELIKIWIGKHLVVAYNGRLMDTLEERLTAVGMDAFRAAELDAQIREHRTRESHPALISKVIAREETALRSLDSAQYGSLLDAVERAAANLAWPAGRQSTDALLRSAKTELSDAEHAQAVVELKRILEPRLHRVTPGVVLAALVEGARMEQVALRFFASTEPNIRAALGLPDASRLLSSEDLLAVFGPSPRSYLSAFLGLQSSVRADRIECRTAGGAVWCEKVGKEQV